jgi:hypothetical protein
MLGVKYAPLMKLSTNSNSSIFLAKKVRQAAAITRSVSKGQRGNPHPN